MTDEKTARIRALNDQLRASGHGGLVLVTRGLLEFGFPFAAQVRAAIARETNFPAGGRLADCEALWESPPRYGLGPAAVAGALSSGRLRPAMSGNEPVSSTIRFRVAFEAK